MDDQSGTHQTEMPLWDSRWPFSKPPGPPRERPPKARATSSRKTLAAKTEDFGPLFSWHQSMPIKLVVQMQFQGPKISKLFQVHQLGMVPICPNRLGICELVFSGCSIWMAQMRSRASETEVLQVPSIFLVDFSGLCKGIYHDIPQKMWLYMVQYPSGWWF